MHVDELVLVVTHVAGDAYAQVSSAILTYLYFAADQEKVDINLPTYPAVLLDAYYPLSGAFY
jgi:hypothetical protein